MAITEAFAVSETITTTEWSLTTDTAGPDTQTDDGVYQVVLELHNLAAGDEYELAGYEKAQAASTQRKFVIARFEGVQSSPVYISPAIILLHGWDFTLVKIAGTDRAINASVRKVA